MTDYIKLHMDAFVADLHCDSIHQIKRGYDFFKENNNYHIDIPRIKKGGVNLQIFALFLDPLIPEVEWFSHTDNLLKILKQTFSHSEEIKLCKSFAEITETLSSNKIVALTAIENGSAIANSLDNLEYFAREGVIYMTLTHAKSHAWCSSSSDNHATEYGLTNFGIDVIKKMNELKMIIDVSHISVRAFNDVIKHSKSPIIASHSNAHALCGHDRNLSDEQLKKIADIGGVVGMNFCPPFLSDELNRAAGEFIKDKLDIYKESMLAFSTAPDEDSYQMSKKKFEPFYNEYKKYVDGIKVSVQDVCNHIDYIVNLIGADHVALGSDFDGITETPIGLEDISQMPLITEELVKRNYDEEDIRKILGKNFLRVFKDVTE